MDQVKEANYPSRYITKSKAVTPTEDRPLFDPSNDTQAIIQNSVGGPRIWSVSNKTWNALKCIYTVVHKKQPINFFVCISAQGNKLHAHICVHIIVHNCCTQHSTNYLPS